jgi:hypothetical protein
MVYSSSLLEANFFTVAQRQEQIKMAEEAKRLLTIQQLNQVNVLARVEIDCYDQCPGS